MILLLAVLILLATPATAIAPQPVYLTQGVGVVEHGADSATKYGYPSDALYINGGDIIGPRNIQGGYLDPARPSMLNLDIGAGSAENPGVLNIGADVSRKVRIQGNRRTLLTASKHGIRIVGRLLVCDDRGCLDVLRALRRKTAPPKAR